MPAAEPQAEPDDPWLPGETAPTDGTKFIGITTLGPELTNRFTSKSVRFEHVEGDLYRRVEEEHAFWNNNTPLLWCPIPPLPSPERVEAAWQAMRDRAQPLETDDDD